MLHDKIALDNHSYVATKSERIRNSTRWILTLNTEGAQQPSHRRPDFAQATRECKRLHDEHLAKEPFLAVNKKDSEKDNRLRKLKNMTMQSPSHRLEVL